MNPKVILLLSGKRKCGKDYLTDQLKNLIGDKCEIVTISKPIKSHWAKEKNLDLKDLLSDSAYKETYRLEMIKWSDEIRQKDYGYFCRAACENATLKPIWIVSDIRRKTDVKWFKETYGDIIRIIRLTADEETRKERGFVFQDSVDNVTSECDLDDYTQWDLVIDNGKDREPLQKQLASVLSLMPAGLA
ncbi:probable phosphomevalonate kinase [Aricia agestis]|uniref:probable phosphomevalonate kinase n=1 Tax=Aricia agestis TaxID=91739 RepID=UPI001C20A0E2|nr:probable phosphomevalonate kinase [Aricia agestis]